MIKFINWFIRPLGYVCVKEEEILESMEKQIMLDIWDEIPKRLENVESFYASYGLFAEKQEYKDNVVPFDKHV